MIDVSADRAASDQQSLYEASLAKNGRTFHWARRFLGDAQGADAAQLYAFCRLLDDLADGDLPNGKERLSVIESDLTRYETDKTARLSDPDMALFAPFMHSRRISSKALRHLIDGLLFDQGTVHLDNEEALITYGYQVAGTVGVMMCPILSCYDPLAHDFAIDLGIAMQLTNIARDVLEDAKMGRRYLPANWVGGLHPDAIAKGAARGDEEVIETVKKAVQKTVTMADIYYKSGLSGLAFLPKRAQIAIAVAAHSYRQIGIQLQAQNLNWHEGRTVTSTATKARVSLRALRFMMPQTKPTNHDALLHQALQGYAK